MQKLSNLQLQLMMAQKSDLLIIIDMQIVLPSLGKKVCETGECFPQSSLLLNISGLDLCHLPHIFPECPDISLQKVTN